MPFAMDPRLSQDAHVVGDLPLCRVLLMDDTRFPWLVLVPRKPGLVELTDLNPSELPHVMEEVRLAGQTIKTIAGYDKLNIGVLGNIVPQLHIHVVGRRTIDEAWPRPVWGAGGARRPYDPRLRDTRIAQIKSEMRLHA